MSKCNCGAFFGDEHLFDCPAHFNDVNSKLAGFGDDSTAVDAPPDKLEIRAGGVTELSPVILQAFHDPGHDPRNYFGRHFYPDGYAGHMTIQMQKTSGWAKKIRRKIAKRFGIT